MRADPPEDPVTRLDGLPVEERTPDYATILRRLRTEFPDWAFLRNPNDGAWIALRGTAERGATIRRSDPLALRRAVEDLQRRPW